MGEPLSRAVAEQAASWYVDLLDAPADQSRREAHQQWLAQSDEHRRAWARLEKLQGRLEQAPAGVARATLNQARTSRRELIKGLAVLLVAGGAGLGWQRSDQYQVLTEQYRTGTGEQRSLSLADGGELVLNTDSSVDVDYSAGARRVILHHGEILVTLRQHKAARGQYEHNPQRAAGTLGKGGIGHCLLFLNGVKNDATGAEPGSARRQLLWKKVLARTWCRPRLQVQAK